MVLNRKLTPLYGMIDTESLSLLKPLEALEMFLAAGVNIVQLRHKGTAREFLGLAKELCEPCRKGGAAFIINDRPDIALMCGADGVHVGDSDIPPRAVRKILGPDAIIGYSTHSLEELREAKKFDVDYLAIGPIFESFTKKGVRLPLGLPLLALARQLIGEMPLVAIGGIGAKSIAQVLSSGADSAAVIGDIYVAGDPKAQIRKLMALGTKAISQKV